MAKNQLIKLLTEDSAPLDEVYADVMKSTKLLDEIETKQNRSELCFIFTTLLQCADVLQTIINYPKH